ncbi:hypothetical protein EMCRGX_G031581 [Ephydatia muelleri]
MEKTSALNTTELGENSSAATGLTELVVIFAPVLLVQLLLGLVSNLLLIALLVKASSVNGQNNINIYLYSLAINNLLTLFPALTLLISTVTKEWVLGQIMCSLNQFVTYTVAVPHSFLQALISRERYRAVVHFSEWKPYSKITYIYVAVVWITAICSGVIGLVQGGQIVGTTEDVLSCYLPNRWMDERRLLPLVVVYLLGSFIGLTASLAFSTVHYAYTFKALYILKRNRIPMDPVMLGHMDIPAISFEAELSPLLLLAINKRFRTRIKDLLRWQLKPTNATGGDAMACACKLRSTHYWHTSASPILLLGRSTYEMGVTEGMGDEATEEDGDKAMEEDGDKAMEEDGDKATEEDGDKAMEEDGDETVLYY